MEWISIHEKGLPEISDLPFVTKRGKEYELWEDSDFFQELTEKEQLEWEYYLPLE